MVRPFKKLTKDLIDFLDDESLYTPAQIAQIGLEKGLFDNEPDIQKAKENCRKAFGAMSRKKEFPKSGDGIVIVKNQGPAFGWLGRRWKARIGLRPNYQGES